MKTQATILLAALSCLGAGAAAADEHHTVTVEAESDGHHVVREVVVKKWQGDEPQIFFLQEGDEVQPGLLKVRSLAVDGGYLGVHLVELTPELRQHFGVDEGLGVMVSKVGDDSPAFRAGIEVGDIVVRADDREVASGHDLRRAVRARAPGEPLELELVRNGRALVLRPEIERRPGPVMLGAGPLRLDLRGCGEGEEECELRWHCDHDNCPELFDSGAMKQSMERLHELLQSGRLPERLHEGDPRLEKRIEMLERRLEEVAREIAAQESELDEPEGDE